MDNPDLEGRLTRVRKLFDMRDPTRREDLMEARNIALDIIEAKGVTVALSLDGHALYRDTWRGDMIALAATGVGTALYEQAFRNALQAHQTVTEMTEALHGSSSPEAAGAAETLSDIYFTHGAAVSWRSRAQGRHWLAQSAAALKKALKIYEGLGDAEQVQRLREALEDIGRAS